MLPALYGAGYSIASRLVLKETVPKGKTRDVLYNVYQKVEIVATFTEGIDLSSPGTWVKAGSLAMGEYLKGGSSKSISTFASENNVNIASTYLRAVGLFLARVNNYPIIAENFEDNKKILEIDLGLGYKLWPAIEGGEGMDFYISTTSGWPALPDQCKNKIRKEFWKGTDTVMMDVDSSNDLSILRSDIKGAKYYGALNDMIPKWEIALDKGIERTVLFQGSPGCGKTTFCYHVANEMGLKSVVIGGEALDGTNQLILSNILKVINPEAVIINDIDRLKPHRLGMLLSYFEDDGISAPFIFLTSNDITKLPQALRRPGRIDRIIEVNRPSKEIEDDVIDKLAAKQGVEIPNGMYPELREMMKDLSPAHVVELFKRAKLYGWDDTEVDGDLTFSVESYTDFKGGG